MLETLYQPILSTHREKVNTVMVVDNDNVNDYQEERESENYGSDTCTSIEYDEEFENLVNSLMHDKDYISVNQAALNITYTIINTGLIAIPFTTYNAGIPLFVSVVLILSIISSYVAVMMISMANQMKVRTLEDLAEVCGGANFFLCVCAFQVMFSFSMMCVTLNVWADIMSDVFSTNNISGPLQHLLSTRRGEVLVGALIILPMCIFKRSMVNLRWTAYLTVCAVAFCLCAVVVAYFSHQEGPSIDTRVTDLVTPKTQWWTVMFVVVFCFSYNQRVFAVYRCLKRRSTERWTNAVRKASCGVTVLYLLFGIAGYLTLARKGVELDNFNYFLDDRGKNIVLYNIARVVVVSSLLLTIPVDSLIASSAWRRLYNRYLKLTASRYHHPSDTACSSSSNFSINADDKCVPQDTVVDVLDQLDGRACDNEGTSSVCTAQEYGQPLHSTSPDSDHSSRYIPISQSTSAFTAVDSLLKEHKNACSPPAPALACSPPVVSLSHLNMLMNQSEVPGTIRRSPSNCSVNSQTSSSVSQLYPDRNSFTSTSTATGGVSSTTGSGVAGNRMISKEEMDSILRANSFEGGKMTKKKLQHEQDAEFDADLEHDLNNSWLSNASISYDSGHDPVGVKSINQGRKRRSAGLDWLTPLVFWIVCIATCIGINHWMYLAATVGTISTTMLLFIFPTMFYFRLTLPSDFGATPICGRLVPNSLYMGLIQAIGIAILLCDIVAIVYLPMSGHHIIRDET